MAYVFGSCSDNKDQLITAVVNNNEIRVGQLLNSIGDRQEKKALADTVMPDGNPIIFVALQKRNKNIFKLLKEAGADLNVINKKTGLGILDVAAMYSETELLPELRFNIRSETTETKKERITSLYRKEETQGNHAAPQHKREGGSMPLEVHHASRFSTRVIGRTGQKAKPLAQGQSKKGK